MFFPCVLSDSYSAWSVCTVSVSMSVTAMYSASIGQQKSNNIPATLLKNCHGLMKKIVLMRCGLP